jgi:hypothetical protein
LNNDKFTLLLTRLNYLRQKVKATKNTEKYQAKAVVFSMNFLLPSRLKFAQKALYVAGSFYPRRNTQKNALLLWELISLPKSAARCLKMIAV